MAGSRCSSVDTKTMRFSGISPIQHPPGSLTHEVRDAQSLATYSLLPLHERTP
jgi:hypothetical protein